jgi:hypothetical protein
LPVASHARLWSSRLKGNAFRAGKDGRDAITDGAIGVGVGVEEAVIGVVVRSRATYKRRRG